MKPWIWPILAILTLVVGCAQGYSDQRSAYQPGPAFTWTQNPESEAQYENRIWREDAGH